MSGARLPAPLLGETGQTLGAVVVVRALTERERLAAERHSLEAQLIQSQKMEALGHLAGGVAHDLNNILTAIVGYAHLAIDESPAGSPVREARPGPRGQGIILLVEDEAQVRQVVRRTLEAAGYQVLVAVDGRQGLDSLRAHRGRVDLVVSDVIMPEMNGAELSAEVRRLYPALPILLMSGYTADVLERGGDALAGVEVMQKPRSPQRLLARVQELVGGRPAAAAPGGAREGSVPGA